MGGRLKLVGIRGGVEVKGKIEDRKVSATELRKVSEQTIRLAVNLVNVETLALDQSKTSDR